MTPQDMAGWDIAALWRGSAQLTDVAESSTAWVTRADTIGQTLSAPGAWDGPASDAGLSSLGTWLAVAARLSPALQALAGGIAESYTWYAQAQDTAASALVAASIAGISVGADGRVSGGPGPTRSMDADQAAAASDRAAAATAVQAQLDEAYRLAARGDALVASDIGVFGGLAVPGFTAQSGFTDLMAAMNVTVFSVGRLPEVPVGAGPLAVAGWWSELSLDAQLRLAREHPDLIGDLDGIPAWARDMANRTLLDATLSTLWAALADPDADLASTLLNDELLFAVSVQQSLAQPRRTAGRPSSTCSTWARGWRPSRSVISTRRRVWR